jgi:(2Fe-2S) ferredoxin
VYWTKKHVLVCTASHCAGKGANDVAARLRLEVVRRGLDAEILVNNCGTIDLCDVGPNLVVYPDNVIYRGVTVRDIPSILGHLTGGPPVEQLTLRADSPEEEARRGFYREVLAGGTPVKTQRFAELAAQHGFDDAWIAEQQRRGFVARKSDDSGQEVIAVTKKTRDRYGLSTS